jgi:hypothetical protein
VKTKFEDPNLSSKNGNQFLLPSQKFRIMSSPPYLQAYKALTGSSPTIAIGLMLDDAVEGVGALDIFEGSLFNHALTSFF